MLGTALDTPRLILRPHTLADAEDCAALWADPQVTRYTLGRPSTPAESWARLLRYVGLWSLLGYGFWTLRERATGRYVGEVGFADFRRELTPALTLPEAGWVLAPWAQGRGFASEALRAALAWADARGMGPLCCLIDPENAPSLRLARQVGFHEAASVTLQDKALVLLERQAGGPP